MSRATHRKVKKAMHDLAYTQGVVAANDLRTTVLSNVLYDDPDLGLLVERKAEDLMRLFAMQGKSRGMGLQSCIEVIWAMAMFMDKHRLWEWLRRDEDDKRYSKMSDMR